MDCKRRMQCQVRASSQEFRLPDHASIGSIPSAAPRWGVFCGRAVSSPRMLPTIPGSAPSPPSPIAPWPPRFLQSADWGPRGAGSTNRSWPRPAASDSRRNSHAHIPAARSGHARQDSPCRAQSQTWSPERPFRAFPESLGPPALHCRRTHKCPLYPKT